MNDYILIALVGNLMQTFNSFSFFCHLIVLSVYILIGFVKKAGQDPQFMVSFI